MKLELRQKSPEKGNKSTNMYVEKGNKSSDKNWRG